MYKYHSRIPLKEAELNSIWVEKVIVCPDCKGTGKTESSYWDSEEGEDITTIITCETCYGVLKYTEMIELKV